LDAFELCQLYPNITEFTLFDSFFNSPKVSTILSYWSHSLTTLRLILVGNTQWNDLLMHQLLSDRVNQLESLQHFSLYIPVGPNFITDYEPRYLFQLKTFNFGCEMIRHHSSKCAYCLYVVLNYLNPNQLDDFSVGLFNANVMDTYCLRKNLSRLIHDQPALASKLTRVMAPNLGHSFPRLLSYRFP